MLADFVKFVMLFKENNLLKRIKMKKLIRITQLMMMLAFIFSVSLVGCEGGQKKEAQRKLEETKTQTVENIGKIKADIESRIEYLDEELDSAAGQVKEDLEAARAELSKQRDLLASQIDDLKEASLENWNEAVKKASEATTKAREKTNEVSKKVREMLDEE